MRSKRLGYSLVCTPLETKRRRDAALASLRLLATDFAALQASGAGLALERASLAARTAEAGQALRRRQAQQQALRELQLEFGATAQGATAMGEQAAPLAAAVAAALSSAEATLQALTTEGGALAARDEPGRRQREAFLRQMEELLAGMDDAGAAQKDDRCSS